MFIMTILFDTV